MISYTHDQLMGLQALMNVGYAHTIKYKLINCSWAVVSWMAAVGKGSHFLQKNSPAEFSGYGPELQQVSCVLITKPSFYEINVYPYHHTYNAYFYRRIYSIMEKTNIHGLIYKWQPHIIVPYNIRRAWNKSAIGHSLTNFHHLGEQIQFARSNLQYISNGEAIDSL